MKQGKAGVTLQDNKALPEKKRRARRSTTEAATVTGSADDEGGRGSANGIRAMLVGLNVLQNLGRVRQPIPLREVAAASDLSPSRVHRYLTSLVELGFVEQDPASGCYSLGRAAVELGLLALGQIDAIRVGEDALFAFGKASGLDGHLSVWGTHGPVMIRWRSGEQGNHLRVDEGRVLPILWTATGRVMMAYRDLAEIINLVRPETEAWNASHPNNPIALEDITRLCEEVRKEGLSASVPFGHALDSQSRAEEEPGLLLHPTFWRSYQRAIEAISVPIFDHRGSVVMAMTFFGADMVSLTDSKENYIQRLQDAAAAASKRLGFSD